MKGCLLHYCMEDADTVVAEIEVSVTLELVVLSCIFFLVFADASYCLRFLATTLISYLFFLRSILRLCLSCLRLLFLLFGFAFVASFRITFVFAMRCSLKKCRRNTFTS
jgi:hypothetical protein